MSEGHIETESCGAADATGTPPGIAASNATHDTPMSATRQGSAPLRRRPDLCTFDMPIAPAQCRTAPKAKKLLSIRERRNGRSAYFECATSHGASYSLW